MAKKYTTIGSVLKSKDKTKPDYIKVSKNVTLKEGQFLNLENKESQLKTVQFLLENSYIDEATAEKRNAAINKKPDFVRFDVVLVEDQN